MDARRVRDRVEALARRRGAVGPLVARARHRSAYPRADGGDLRRDAAPADRGGGPPGSEHFPLGAAALITPAPGNLPAPAGAGGCAGGTAAAPGALGSAPS